MTILCKNEFYSLVRCCSLYKLGASGHRGCGQTTAEGAILQQPEQDCLRKKCSRASLCPTLGVLQPWSGHPDAHSHFSGGSNPVALSPAIQIESPTHKGCLLGRTFPPLEWPQAASKLCPFQWAWHEQLKASMEPLQAGCLARPRVYLEPWNKTSVAQVKMLFETSWNTDLPLSNLKLTYCNYCLLLPSHTGWSKEWARSLVSLFCCRWSSCVEILIFGSEAPQFPAPPSPTHGGQGL